MHIQFQPLSKTFKIKKRINFYLLLPKSHMLCSVSYGKGQVRWAKLMLSTKRNQKTQQSPEVFWVPSCDFASWLGTLCILQQLIAHTHTHTVDRVKHSSFRFYPLHLLWTSSAEETTLDFEMLCLPGVRCCKTKELKGGKCQRTQILSLCKWLVIFLNIKGISQNIANIRHSANNNKQIAPYS